MPELAEVETIKKYLADSISGRKIIGYNQNRNKLRYDLDYDIEEKIINNKIIKITRRAKFLQMELSNRIMLSFHLGMSGRLTIYQGDYIEKKHDHIIINLCDNYRLVFNDARRFGMLYIYHKDQENKQKFLQNMGQEPLEKEFDAKYLYEKLHIKKSPIKTALMDNRIVVGVGNIYAAESLFLAKINPLKIANQLTMQEIELLVIAIKEVLIKAIKAGGTTLKDFVNGDNKPGYFKQELNVYGRNNLPCNNCNNIISKIIQAGRSSFFCPNCQIL